MYALSVLPLALGSTAIAQDFIWTGPAAGNFWEANYWNTGNLDFLSGDNIIINGNATETGQHVDLTFDSLSNNYLTTSSENNYFLVGNGSGNNATLNLSITDDAYSSYIRLNTVVGENGGHGVINYDSSLNDNLNLSINTLSVGHGNQSLGVINVLSSGKQTRDQDIFRGAEFSVKKVNVGIEGGQGVFNLNGGAVDVNSYNFDTENTSYYFSLGQGQNSIGEFNILGGGKLAVSVYEYMWVTLLEESAAVIGLEGGQGTLNISGRITGEDGNSLASRAHFGLGLTVGKDVGSVGQVNVTEGGLLRTLGLNSRFSDSIDTPMRMNQLGVDGGTGSVLVTGENSRWEVAGSLRDNQMSDEYGTPGELQLGRSGNGTLTISDQGVVAIGRIVQQYVSGEDPITGDYFGYQDYRFTSEQGQLFIASEANAVGVLNIGAAVSDAAVAAGTLEAESVVFGDGEGRIVFNHTDNDYVFNPTLSGNGTLIQKSGTTWLTGDNSNFSGNVSMNGGTLGAANNHSFGDATVNVSATSTLHYANNVSLANPIVIDTSIAATSTSGVTLNAFVDQNATATQTGQISGTGNFQKIGLGQLTLTEVNNLTGLVTVSEGRLALGENASLANAERIDVQSQGVFDVNAQLQSSIQRLSGSGLVNILDGKELIITNAQQEDEYSGQLNGAGTLTLADGIQRMTGNSANTFTGTASVMGGTLVVDGQIGGTLTAYAGGTVAGIGSVGRTTIHSGATISPGQYGSSLPSTITVNGDLTLNPGAYYALNLTSTNSDLIRVQGQANVNQAQVNIVKEAGLYTPGSRWKIVETANGLTGAFAPLMQDLPYVDLVHQYDDNNAYLSVVRNDKDLCGPGMTGNECSTGNNLDLINNVIAGIVASQLSTEASKNALNQLSGELYASTKIMTIDDSRFIRETVNNALITGKQQRAGVTNAWAHGFGSWSTVQKVTNHSSSVKHDIGGIFIGADRAINDTLQVGVIAGYSRANIEVNELRSKTKRDDYHLGAFLGANWNKLSVRSGLSYTWHDFSSERHIEFPAFKESTYGNYHGSTTQIFTEASYQFNVMDKTILEPFAQVAYVSVKTDSFAETGDLARLNLKGDRENLFYSTLGLRAEHYFDLGNNNTLKVWGSAGWQHAYGSDSAQSVYLNFQNNAHFKIESAPIAKNSAIINLGFEAKLSPALTLSAQYNGKISSKFKDHGGKMALTWSF